MSCTSPPPTPTVAYASPVPEPSAGNGAPLEQVGPARARLPLCERLDPSPSLSQSLSFVLHVGTAARRGTHLPVAWAAPQGSDVRWSARISHTFKMATGLKVGGDVEQALEHVGVPSYVLDEAGVVRWLNPAAERLLGDVRGRQFTSVIAPEDRPGARERFAQKMLGTSVASEATGHLVSTAGTRVPVEVSAVALKDGETGGRRLRADRGPPRRQRHSATPASHPPPSRGASSSGAGLLDEADRRRAPSEHRDGQEPRPPSLSSPRRQHPTRGRRRRTGRIALSGLPLAGRASQRSRRCSVGGIASPRSGDDAAHRLTQSCHRRPSRPHLPWPCEPGAEVPRGTKVDTSCHP